MAVDPSNQSMTDSIEPFVRLAYQFGPFLFAILFMIVITRTAHKYYNEVNSRTDPPPTPAECSVYRLFFFSSFGFGIVLVSLSVGWWFYSQLQPHVYEIIVQDLDDFKVIQIEDAFERKALKSVGPDNIPRRNHHFVVVRDNPFPPGHKIRLRMWETDPTNATGGTGPRPTPIVLHVQYGGERRESFEYANGQLIKVSARDDRRAPHVQIAHYQPRLEIDRPWPFSQRLVRAHAGFE